MSLELTKTNGSGIQETVERALELSTTDQCLVIAQEQSSVNLRWANNAVISNGASRNQRLTVVSIVNGAAGAATGVVSRNGVTAASLQSAIDASAAAARSGVPAEDAQPLLTGDSPSCNWDDPPLEAPLRMFDLFVPELEAAIAKARDARHLLFGYAHHGVRSVFVASSTGLRKRHNHSSGYVQLNLRSSDYGNSVWTGTNSVDFSIPTLDSLYRTIRERLNWSQRRRVPLPAGRYEVLLAPSAVADLMVSLYDALGAQDAYRGRSVFSHRTAGTRIGERLCRAPIILRSDPQAQGMECLPFVVATSSHSGASVFDNGLPLKPTTWINQGVLSALTQTRSSARLTGLPVTPRIDNLIMDHPGSGSSQDEMIRRTARGLLVSCLWYVREVDGQTLLLTGLTRDGVFLIDGGEVAGAVNNFRFNESPVGLLNRITEMGTCEPALGRERGSDFPRTKMSWLRINDFNMTSTSEAS
jgi:predicted Zn-dependent protease